MDVLGEHYFYFKISSLYKCLCVAMYTHMSEVACRAQERVLDPLELKLLVEPPNMDFGNQTRVT